MSLPTCCEYHAAQLPDGNCRQGRDCPCRKPCPTPDYCMGHEAAYPEAGYLPIQQADGGATVDTDEGGMRALRYGVLAAVVFFVGGGVAWLFF